MEKSFEKRIHITYQLGKMFQRFKEKVKFTQMVKKFGVDKSTVIFRINSLKLMHKYLRLMRSSVNLNF